MKTDTPTVKQVYIRERPLSESEIPEALRKVYNFCSQRVEFIPSNGKRRMTIARTCLQCKTTERVQVMIIRGCIKVGNLSGLCKSCSRHLSHSMPKGEASHNWKGGRRETPHGYIMIHCPDHPCAQNDYVFEHRLVMEQKLGRLLLPTETIHHKNGIKDDNRIENLELWTKNHSDGHRYDDLSIDQLEDLIICLQALLGAKKKAHVAAQ